MTKVLASKFIRLLKNQPELTAFEFVWTQPAVGLTGSLGKTQPLSKPRVVQPACRAGGCMSVCLSASVMARMFYALKCTFIILHSARAVLACIGCRSYVGLCCAAVSWVRGPLRRQIKALNRRTAFGFCARKHAWLKGLPHLLGIG